MSWSPGIYSLSAKYHPKYVLKLFKQYSDSFGWFKRSNMKILDIGVGPGHVLLQVEPLFPRDYTEIIGIDKDVAMLNYLNSVTKDPRISSQLMDIEAEKIPGNMEGRFDFAFSSYCLSHLTNIRQTFINTKKMLNRNGELFFIWCRKSQINDIHKAMSKIAKWAPYTTDYKNWRPYFDNEDPKGTLEKEVTQAGLTVLRAELLDDIVFEDAEPQIFIDLFAAFDLVSLRIPKADLPKYKEDFNKIAASFIFTDENAEIGLKAKFPFPSIVLAAKQS
ncbi:hypothetical protein HHI36_012198 [Cryptolaemus montrouzieri]|uniref:Methyltransferase domain-containing protein n=1 Tax=Cryptolaemus montrouzieri TaxID=559131 RepID=A0ABD2NEA2_9CUCU